MEHWSTKKYSPYQTISTFFVEIHLDVFLEVLLMVGLDFFSTKLVELKISQEDSVKKLGWLIYNGEDINISTIEEKNEF